MHTSFSSLESCVAQSCTKKQERHRWTEVAGERADGLQLGCCGSDCFNGSDGFDDVDGAMEWWCRVVKPFRWLRSWASQAIGKFLKTSLQMMTTPREADGSRSLRRVDKIDGETS